MSNKKHRQLNTKLWQQRWFQDLSHRARYLYLYLLTNPHCNLSGVYEIMDRQIEFDTGLKNVQEVFVELDKAKEVFRFRDFVIVVRFPDNHKWKTSWSIGKGYINELEELSKDLINAVQQTGYHYPPIMSEGALENERIRTEQMRIDAMNKKKEKQDIRKDTTNYDEQSKSSQYYQQDNYEPFTEEVPF